MVSKPVLFTEPIMAKLTMLVAPYTLHDATSVAPFHDTYTVVDELLLIEYA